MRACHQGCGEGRFYSLGDYDEIVPGLFMGSNPHDADLRGMFEVVVCASYHSSSRWTGGMLVWAPFPDSEVEYMPEHVPAIAELVANEVAGGRRVLVHCDAGYDRSGLIVALALMRMGDSAQAAIARVRAKRGVDALANDSYMRLIREAYVGRS